MESAVQITALLLVKYYNNGGTALEWCCAWTYRCWTRASSHHLPDKSSIVTLGQHACHSVEKGNGRLCQSPFRNRHCVFSSFQKAVAVMINTTQCQALKCSCVRWIKAVNDYMKGPNHSLICYHQSRRYSSIISVLCLNCIIPPPTYL